MALSHSQLHPDTSFSFLVKSNKQLFSSISLFHFTFPIVLSVVAIILQLIFSGLGSPQYGQMLQWGLTRYLRPQGSSVKLSSPVSNKVRNNFIEMKNFTVLQNLS